MRPRIALLIAVVCMLMVGVGPGKCFAEQSGTALRVFEEKERSAMLNAYHARMCRERHIPISDLKAWTTRRAQLVKQMLDGFGLDPAPPKGPLDVTYGTKLERDDCTISRVYYQTFPGFYATAFLYMPKKAKFPAPAILNPHGHWANWSADDIVQSRCIGLARRGYVCLAVQYEHYEDPAIGLTARGVFLWNNIRGLDLLASLPQVDPKRIGATGASGGGMQSMDIAAVDERVRAAAIGVFPTYFKRILYRHALGCWCNFAPLGALTRTDQHETVALIAPKPALVFSVTGDWTANSIDEEMKQVAGVYDLFAQGGAPTVPNVEGKQAYRLRTSRNGRFLVERFGGPHDYTQKMRERMYWWMDWWLKGTKAEKPGPEGEIKLESPNALKRLRWKKPKGHQWSNANLAAVVRPGLRFQRPPMANKADLKAHVARMKTALVSLLGEKGMTYGPAGKSASVGTQTVGGWDVERLWFESEPETRIPALLIRPAGKAASPAEVTILLAPNGKNDVFLEPWRSRCQAILGQGRAVLALDQRLRGEWSYKMAPPGQVPEITWRGNARVWGRPEVGMAACDVRRAIDYLAARKDTSVKAVQVAGWGQAAGFAALLAAAMDGRIAECTSDLDHDDFAIGRRAPVVPRILRHGDVGEIAALVAPRRLHLANVNPRTSLQTCEAAYRLRGASKQLSVSQGEQDHEQEVAIVNGGFERGATGWKPATLFTKQADLGKACLRVEPGQTVTSDPIAVQPLRESRVVLHLSKPWQARCDIFLLRGESRRLLVADYNGRLGFQEQTYEFLTRPNEKSVRLVFTVPKGTPAHPPILIDTVRLLQGRSLELPKPDGKELLHVSDFTRLPVGSDIPRRAPKGQCFIPYGPNSVAKVVAEGKDGRQALYLKSDRTYVACGTPVREPLRPGGTYRFTVVARGKGRLTLNFWRIPNYLSPRWTGEVTGDWATYSVDFFVESSKQLSALPVVSLAGEGHIDRMSLKLVDPGGG